MNFLEIVQKTCQRVGITQPTTLLNTTDTNVLMMMDMINEIYEGIANGGEGDETLVYQKKWSWTETDTRITLFPTYKGTDDGGTVSGSAGSAVLTFVASALQTAGVAVGDWVQQVGQTQWYEILTVDGELQATLTTNLAEAWAAGSTFRIVRPAYELPAGFARLRAEVLYPRLGDRVVMMPWLKYQTYIADRRTPIQEGYPLRASIYGMGTTNRMIYFDRSPEEADDVVIPYNQDITLLALDADIPLVPVRHHRIFVFATAARFLIDVLEDSGGAVYEARYKALLASMVAEQDTGDTGDLQLEPDMDAYEAQVDTVLGAGDSLAHRMAYQDNS